MKVTIKGFEEFLLVFLHRAHSASRVVPKAKNDEGNHPAATLTTDLHVPKLRILQSRFPM